MESDTLGVSARADSPVSEPRESDERRAPHAPTNWRLVTQSDARRPGCSMSESTGRIDALAWCAKQADGTISGEGFVPADEDGLARLVLELGPEVRACLEMMSGAVWVRDRLA